MLSTMERMGLNVLLANSEARTVQAFPLFPWEADLVLGSILSRKCQSLLFFLVLLISGFPLLFPIQEGQERVIEGTP